MTTARNMASDTHASRRTYPDGAGQSLPFLASSAWTVDARGAAVTAVCSTRNVAQARPGEADNVADYLTEDFMRSKVFFIPRFTRMDLLASGQVRRIVERTSLLTQTAVAMHHLSSGQPQNTIVVTVGLAPTATWATPSVAARETTR